MVGAYIKNILKAVSEDEDSKRQEFILNVILSSMIALCVTAVLISLLYPIISGKDNFTASPVALLAILILFLFLFWLSKKGFARVASYILITIFGLILFQLSYSWGADLPQAVLSLALLIVIASILIGTRFSIILTGLIGVFLLYLTRLQTNLLITIDSSWKAKPVMMADTIATIVTLFVIAIVSWLSNREIEKSLRRARSSEKALKEERDLLEVKVEERTRELKETEMEKMKQMANFAELGRLASGIFHDLANPLTALSLNLTKLKGDQKFSTEQSYLQEALIANRRIEKFILSLRKLIQQQEVSKKFSIQAEIKEAIQIFSYKAKKSGIEILLHDESGGVDLIGNPVKFHQAIANLISNAIDAYKNFDAKNKQISITTRKGVTYLVVEVRDFGKGIEKELLPKIFDPFVTTKGLEDGTGIGLFMVKNIVEKDFRGEVIVESNISDGCQFTLKFQLPR